MWFSGQDTPCIYLCWSQPGTPESEKESTGILVILSADGAATARQIRTIIIPILIAKKDIYAVIDN